MHALRVYSGQTICGKTRNFGFINGMSAMMRTIVTSSHISVQGEYVQTLKDGRVVVRIGDKLHIGQLISALRDTIKRPEGVSDFSGYANPA